MGKYKCGECGLSVIIIHGEEPIKACNCDAPIIAEIEGNATGSGGIKIE